MDKRKALGRGLGALIPNLPRVIDRDREREAAAPVESQSSAQALDKAAERVPAHAPPAPAPAGKRDFFLCPIEEIMPSPDNPRQSFSEERLDELAASIKAQGLVQPLVVRLRPPEEIKPGKASFVLIAGERRWRAAQRAALKEVPVVVKDVSANRAFELALVENLQREDLNAIEEAEAYRRLSDEFGYTQEELAQRVGRARETVANSLRLLKLPDRVRGMVARDDLSMGHARALLGLDDENRITLLALQVLEKRLSVRQTELLVRRAKEVTRGEADPQGDGPKKPAEKTPAVRDLEERLQKALGTRVRVQVKDAQAGRIEIEYHSLDQLDGLIRRLGGEPGD